MLKQYGKYIQTKIFKIIFIKICDFVYHLKLRLPNPVSLSLFQPFQWRRTFDTSQSRPSVWRGYCFFSSKWWSFAVWSKPNGSRTYEKHYHASILREWFAPRMAAKLVETTGSRTGKTEWNNQRELSWSAPTWSSNETTQATRDESWRGTTPNSGIYTSSVLDNAFYPHEICGNILMFVCIFVCRLAMGFWSSRMLELAILDHRHWIHAQPKWKMTEKEIFFNSILT